MLRIFLKNLGDENNRLKAYGHYRNCLMNLINIASTPEGIPPGKIVLDSDIAPPELEIVPFGKRFVMKFGDLIALGSAEVLLSYAHHGSNGPTFQFTNTLTGETEEFRHMEEGRPMKFVNCNVIPYNIDNENQISAILSVCDK